MIDLLPIAAKLHTRWRLYRSLHVGRRQAVCYVVRVPAWTVDVCAGVALAVLGAIMAILLLSY